MRNKDKEDYNAALHRMEKLWGSKPGTAGGDDLDVLATLVDRYEEHHFPIQMKDPVLALLNLIKEQNIERKELPIALIGKSKVSKVLNRKRSYLAL